MKKLFCLHLYIFLFILLLIGCREEKSTTVFSGILPELQNTRVTFIPVDEYFPGLQHSKSYPTVNTDRNGNFKIVFYPDQSRFYQLLVNNHPKFEYDFYLTPGDSIHVIRNVDHQNPELLITGEGSEKLKYLENDFDLTHQEKFNREKLSDLWDSDYKAYKKVTDSLYLQRITALQTNEQTPSELIHYQLNALQAERINQVLSMTMRLKFDFDNAFEI